MRSRIRDPYVRFCGRPGPIGPSYPVLSTRLLSKLITNLSFTTNTTEQDSDYSANLVLVNFVLDE